jgi:FtsZ-binding cell division protein ZapB
VFWHLVEAVIYNVLFVVGMTLQVDAAILQYQNQKLAQQLDFQLTEISALENRCNQLKSKQALHDETLMMVNGVWNQVCPSTCYSCHLGWFT